MAGPKRQRTLNDLYLLGRTVVLTDGTDPIVVWLQKLNPADHQAALRKANAARARTKVAMLDDTSEEALGVLDEIHGWTRESMVELLIGEERTNLEQSVEAEVEGAEGSEWGADGYLQGLRDAWLDHGRALYAEDENDPTARRILNEFARLSEAVTAAIEPQLKSLREQWEAVDDEVLRSKAVERWKEVACQEAWVAEFELAQLWLAVRKPCDICLANAEVSADEQDPHLVNHEGYYFPDLAHVAALEAPVRLRLLAEYRAFSVDPVEGKDSPAQPASSEPSESPEPEATSPVSGPAAAG